MSAPRLELGLWMILAGWLGLFGAFVLVGFLSRRR